MPWVGIPLIGVKGGINNIPPHIAEMAALASAKLISPIGPNFLIAALSFSCFVSTSISLPRNSTERFGEMSHPKED
jgi:hypothetical protein